MEQWKPIVGAPDYQISNRGRAKSLKRTMIRVNGRSLRVNERILAPSKDTKGYYQVYPYINGKRKPVFVHRLVFATFVRPLKPKEQVHHIDGNILNNNIENLEAVTHDQHWRITKAMQEEKHYNRGYKAAIRDILRILKEENIEINNGVLDKINK